MKTGLMPWSNVMLAHALRYQHATCFALGCIEREHRLNVNAWLAHWAQAPVAWWAWPPARAPRASGSLSAAHSPHGAR
jgi:hypothetical protein